MIHWGLMEVIPAEIIGGRMMKGGAWTEKTLDDHIDPHKAEPRKD